jgi:hypothetical protein
MKIDIRFSYERLKSDDDAFSRIVRILSESAIYLNRLFLQDKPFTPRLYTSGVRYLNEPIGQVDELIDIPEILRRGAGDCFHLSAWRVAELRNDGEEGATIHVRRQRHPIKKLRCFHVLVRRADGETEDPSRLLGM